MSSYTRWPASSSVNTVTASSPLASSGGATPNISLTGVVAVANGGTNSSTALSNNRFIISSGSKIVEASAVTASRALASDANGLPVASATTATELGFVNGVTSAIQTQLNAKQATGSYITALTGDVTASGPGSVAATIAATSNSTITTLSGLTSATNFISKGVYGSRPAAGKAGRIYLQTDGYTVDRDNGVSWDSFGPINPITPPDPAYSWSWVNQNSATIAAFNGGLLLTTIANTGTNSARVKSLPVAPYTITVLIQSLNFVVQGTGTGPFMGLCLRESSTGKAITLATSFGFSKHLTSSYRLDASLNYSSTNVDAEIVGLNWLRFKDDGATRFLQGSNDGFNFITLYSEANNAYIVPNQVGFLANSFQSTQPTTLTIYSWVEGP
jgi:hypothetical protein